VPKVRPHEYSLPASQIIDEVKQNVALGYKEVVLTGTKVGSYRDGSTDLRDLAQRILSNTGIERLRLSSLQPSEIFSEFLALRQDERLCRHFHLALQSGSETVLQRMQRSYSLDQYQRTVNLIKETIPDAAITTDIMVGFPGESDEEFEQSYSFCQQAGFANIHVFPFSARPETAAAGMPQQTKDKVKQERNQRMLELSRSSRRSFCEQFLGQTMPVLWEKETSPGSGIYSGLTGNYIRVFADSEKSLDNEITPVKLTEFHNQGIWGEVVNENPG
jgi:threonylcarbamoyladenosine tRNA methylthiotransferase MtaB